MQHEAQLHSACVDQSAPNHPNSYDYSSYFRDLHPIFEGVDIIAANIETTFAAPPYRGYPSFNSPSSLAVECYNSGINLFFAANNHIMDSGSKGLESTISLYKRIGVPYMGIYRDSCDAKNNHPLIIEKKGVRIAFLNYTYGTNDIRVTPPYVVNLLDTISVKRDLIRTKELKPDKIIVSVHWGEEYHLSPSPAQERWERFFYRNGAHLIIGAHPHVPQPIRVYRGEENRVERLTAFSLGNVISNMSAKNCRVGILLEILLLKDSLNGVVTFGEPKVTLIWSKRGNGKTPFKVVPLERGIEQAQERGELDGQYYLMREYYNKFNNRVIDERANN